MLAQCGGIMVEISIRRNKPMLNQEEQTHVVWQLDATLPPLLLSLLAAVPSLPTMNGKTRALKK